MVLPWMEYVKRQGWAPTAPRQAPVGEPPPTPGLDCGFLYRAAAPKTGRRKWHPRSTAQHTATNENAGKQP